MSSNTTNIVPGTASADVSVQVRSGLDVLQSSIAEARQALAVALAPIDPAKRTFGESFRGATEQEVIARQMKERSERVRLANQVLDERIGIANRVATMASVAVRLENLSKAREASRLKAEIKVLTLTQDRLRREEELEVFTAEREHRERVRQLGRERELVDLRVPKTAAAETLEERAAHEVDAELARRRAAAAAESALIADFIRQAEGVFADSAIGDTERMLKLRALLEVYGMESADLPGAVRDFLHAEEASGV